MADTSITIAPEVEKGVKSLQKYAEDLNITTLEHAEDASHKLFQVSDLKKKVEDQRTMITKPMNLALRSTNAFFKRFSDPLETVDEQIRAKLLLFSKDVTERAFGVAHLRKNTVIRVTDPAKLPRKYMMPDMAKIKLDVKAGKEIAGIEVTEEDSVSL